MISPASVGIAYFPRRSRSFIPSSCPKIHDKVADGELGDVKSVCSLGTAAKLDEGTEYFDLVKVQT